MPKKKKSLPAETDRLFSEVREQTHPLSGFPRIVVTFVRRQDIDRRPTVAVLDPTFVLTARTFAQNPVMPSTGIGLGFRNRESECIDGIIGERDAEISV